jgi:hypothetical protein
MLLEVHVVFSVQVLRLIICMHLSSLPCVLHVPPMSIITYDDPHYANFLSFTCVLHVQPMVKVLFTMPLIVQISAPFCDFLFLSNWPQTTLQSMVLPLEHYTDLKNMQFSILNNVIHFDFMRYFMNCCCYL